MPYVIHRYLQKLKTNPCPPGLADFLRGTITLYQYSQKYGYTLKVDTSSHPLFKILDVPSNIKVSIPSDEDTYEIIYPIAYNDMPKILDDLFSKGSDINIITHAYFSEISDMSEEYNFIKLLLTPNQKLIDLISSIKRELTIDFSKPYITIHVRTGDESLVKNIGDSNITINAVEQISKYISNMNPVKQVLLITDSREIKARLKNTYATVSCNPVHIGMLNTENLIDDLFRTMAEFFLMSTSSEIHCISRWVTSSGFSSICSKVYGIPYTLYGLM
jgi:hypothetical protein